VSQGPHGHLGGHENYTNVLKHVDPFLDAFPNCKHDTFCTCFQLFWVSVWCGVGCFLQCRFRYGIGIYHSL
jgi:hypothetical protein